MVYIDYIYVGHISLSVKMNDANCSGGKMCVHNFDKEAILKRTNWKTRNEKDL